ncbi:MAG: nucleoside-diphosphate sugar epimerase [Phycisphaeraceae bacterium]|nr:nucleoside-diphosphate sugar epimerase [Phycisphaeraceae bacterium]
MLIAITGATGFLGRYITSLFLGQGHRCRCWHRPDSDRGGFVHDGTAITWIEGGLHQPDSIAPLIDGADAVVHAGLYRPSGGAGHRGAESDLMHFAQVNLMGSLGLITAAHRAAIPRFVFISTCGVHDVILDDRALDETHPLWPQSHYGAHKAAIEKFVHSHGLACALPEGAAPTHRHLETTQGWGICALRPCGIYGLRRPVEDSKWHAVVRDVKAGRTIDDASGGKEVHAEDVARAVRRLLDAEVEQVRGRSFNCCDLYVAAQDVAVMAKTLTGSSSEIVMRSKNPRHQIDTTRLQALGMEFQGRARLERYVCELVERC